MSSDAEKKRRQEALETLKMKKQGLAPSSNSTSGTLSFRSSIDSSPVSNSILVPASSSPAQPLRPFGPSTSHASPMPKYPGGIPSSNLNRPNANGSSATSGTPSSVMNAIHNRKTAEDVPRAAAGGAGGSSFSYEGTTSTSSRPDLSPSSPAPLSRLKARYTDDSPTKISSTASTPVSTPAIKRTPSLIAAAKEQTSELQATINRCTMQFDRVPRGYVVNLLQQYKGDLPKATELLAKMQNEQLKLAASSSSQTSSPISSGYIPPPRPINKLPTKTSVSSSSGSASASGSIPIPSSSLQPVSAQSFYSTAIKATKPPPKPKKNEKSAIYRHQNKPAVKERSKKRDPDESDSAEEEEEDDRASDDGSEMSWSGDESRKKKKRKMVDDEEEEEDAEGAALKAFNEVAAEVLTGTIACSIEQANTIIKLRPYEDADQLRTKLNKARGVSVKLFEQYVDIMEGYVQIDSCLNKCEAIAKDVANTLAVWRGAGAAREDSVVGTPGGDGLNDVKVDVNKVSELLKQELDPRRQKILKSYLQVQPAGLSEGTVLKDYQLLGVNWLNLLFSKKIGCILADEMGLGKTIQVIAFLAALSERGIKGPHMIFVPASTLENWIREFEKFAPDIDVTPYYGTQSERAVIRDDIKRRFRSGRLRVVLASYTQVASHDDLSFFRKKVEFTTCIYDEGHKLKNCQTKAYTDLLSIKPKWRLLLTGTPLQNNLQELVSLLMFIHKDVFTDAEPYLRAIFKSQGQANLLSQQRVSRARTMLTPFVLRRRKANVLDLPPKVERIHKCHMTPAQKALYDNTMHRSKKILEELDDETLEAEAAADDDDLDEKKGPGGGKKTAANGNGKKKNGDGTENAKKKSGVASSGAHILMDLRKAASHPLLFRRLYTDAKIKKIAKACLNTPTWCDANYDYVVEDLEIMSDAELHNFCVQSDYDAIRAFKLKDKDFMEGGKIEALKEIIEQCQKEDKRILLFSQFVMILDILQVALKNMKIKFTRLDGSTKTDERQGLVDEFNDDPDITVFLLSTKAGGVGINLTAASVVVIYDQDFNPHNDRQAADRAYRIGQEKKVEVIKLITEGSIDEDMLEIGLTKLKLDDMVGGEEATLDGEAGNKDDKTAKEMKKSLLTTLRNKFDATAPGENLDDIKEEDRDEDMKEEKTVKKARGSILPKEDPVKAEE